MLANTSFTDPTRTVQFHRLLTAIEKPILVPLCWLMIGLSPLIRLINLQNYLSGMLHLSCHLTGFAGRETVSQLEKAAKYGITSSPASSGRALLAMFKYEARDVLPNIPVPALVITGSDDIVTLPSAGKIIAESIHGAVHVHMSPAGHLGLFEQYERFDQNIGEWSHERLLPRPQQARSA